jgi:DNA-binding MarR family transcriptional regulator
MPKRAPDDAARQLGELFPAVYLRFHRRDGKTRALPAASRAVLHHLTLSGPIGIGELARHLERAQSVVSGIVSHLVRDGLLEREKEPGDARRTLVWLSERGLARLAGEQEVLARDLVTRAMGRMSAADVTSLLRGMRALVAAGDPVRGKERDPKPRRTP